MIFYDFEVFERDWLAVFIDVTNQKEHVIINDKDKLRTLYERNMSNIWVGFNNRHYDQYIMKNYERLIVMRVFTLPAENWNELSIDKQVIRHLILKHRSFVDHLITLEDYYEGKHKILNDKNRENKLVCNHAKDISDTASSYFIGNPVTYKAQTDITDLTDKLEYAGADEADGDNGLDLSIFGRAYEYIYTKKDETDLMIKNLSPANTFVVYDDTIEQNELFAVYYYAKRDDSDRTDIKYIATVVTEHYKYILNIQNIDGIQPTYEQAEPHYKGEVPIIEYLNNKMGLGDFELQIPLIDAYNALMSDRVTDKEQFIDAILSLADLLVYTDADSCNKSIATVEKIFQEAVEAAVQEKLKGGDPQKKAPEGNKELETQIEKLMRGY